MQQPAQFRVRRVGSPTAPALLRIRADEQLLSWLSPPSPGDGGRLTFASDEALALGQRLRVEFSFGAMADEVTAGGMVATSTEDGAGHVITLRFAVEHAEKVQYVIDVLDGSRAPTARRSRRAPCDLLVHWRRGPERFTSRLADLSRGGAFIVSDKIPEVTTELDVEIPGESGPLQFQAKVTWIRPGGERPGFGVSFRLPDRDSAAALSAMVRAHEGPLPAHA